MPVKVFKLVTGEEVLANNTETSGDSVFSLSKPRVIQVMPQRDGQMGAALIPWLIAAPDSDVVIKAENIMAIVEVSRDVEKMYLQQTSTLDLTGSI